MSANVASHHDFLVYYLYFRLTDDKKLKNFFVGDRTLLVVTSAESTYLLLRRDTLELFKKHAGDAPLDRDNVHVVRCWIIIIAGAVKPIYQS